MEEELLHEPKHTVVVGCLVRDRQRRVLLIRHHRRGWEIPQGRVEEGEGLLSALHREVKEETGVSVVIGPLVAVYSKLSPPAAVIFNFLADYLGGELQASEETPELDWFDSHEALPRVTHPVNRDRLATLLAFDGRLALRSYSSGPFRVQDEVFLEWPPGPDED